MFFFLSFFPVCAIQTGLCLPVCAIQTGLRLYWVACLCCTDRSLFAMQRHLIVCLVQVFRLNGAKYPEINWILC